MSNDYISDFNRLREGGRNCRAAWAAVVIPGEQECLKLMAEYGMLPHIQEHSRKVRDVAMCVGEACREAGLAIHLPLLEAGALLHDIAKTDTLQQGGDHARLGAERVAALGYPAVAAIVQGHVYVPDELFLSATLTEVELVNYADKRVKHIEVVTLTARFEDLMVRYGKSEWARERITANAARSQVLEKKIFRPLSLMPSDLLKLNHMGRPS